MAQPHNPKPFNKDYNNGKAEDLGLQSSFLARASYDSASQKLTLSFHSGQEMAYWPVDEDTWEEFRLAPSQGRYYLQNIKGKSQSMAIQQPLKPSDIKQPRKVK